MATPEDVRVDFFSFLPPEVVLQILLYLRPRDLLSCMAVCKVWWDILGLSDMEPCWRLACQELGLTGEIIKDLLTTLQSARSVFCAALKHRNSIYSTEPKYMQMMPSYPYNVHYVCQYARRRTLVGMVYQDFLPCYLLVQRVDREAVATVRKLRLGYPRITENRVIWAHIHDQFLFCATASGIWSVLVLQEVKSRLLVHWRTAPLYDCDVRVTCCERCGLICSAKLARDCSSWEFQVFEVTKHTVSSNTKKLPMPKATKLNWTIKNRHMTPRRVPLGKKRVFLLSQTIESDSNGFCSSHLLLVQWANEVSALALKHKTEVMKTAGLCLLPTAVRKFTAECEDYDTMVMRNHGLNTEFVLSEDNALLGFIFQSCLHTWKVQTGEQMSMSKIVLDSYNSEEMRLISLGHIYSIVGLEFDSSFIVFSTINGQKLLKCADFAKSHCPMVPPFIAFYSSVENQWLSDISQLCSTRILYWNKTNRSIEGISIGMPVFKADTSAVATQQKRWPWQRRE